MKKYDETEGVWRTVGGRRIFIKNGQSLSEAMIESGKFKKISENSKLSLEEMKKISDVTDEYLNEVRPKRNQIKKDKGFIERDHEHENAVVKFLYDKFGGKFRQIQEIYAVEHIKFPDFKWRGKFWEIKKVTSLNAIDNGCRKALRQINKNGGIVLDIHNTSLADSDILNQVAYRLKRSGGECDVIVLRETKELIAVLRKKE